MAPPPKERLNPLLRARVASLLPDRSRLNFLLTSKSNFQGYEQFLKDGLQRCTDEEVILHTGWLSFKQCTAACPLKHAVEYSDVTLFGDLLNGHIGENKNGLTEWRLDALVEQCITAGSSQCLAFLCRMFPYVRQDKIRRGGDYLRENARLQYHTSMVDVLNRYHAPHARHHLDREAVEGYGAIVWNSQPRLRNAKLYEAGVLAKESNDIHQPPRHARLCEAASGEVFRFLYHKAQSELQPKELGAEVWLALCVHLAAIYTSSCLVETILAVGQVSVDSVHNLNSFDQVVASSHGVPSAGTSPSSVSHGADAMTLLDYAISNLNIDAVCALRNQGANMGGARAVKYDQAITNIDKADASNIPTPIWRIFDQKIQDVGCCFWAKHHLHKSDQQFDARSKACKRRLCSEFAAFRMAPNDDLSDSDDDDSEDEDDKSLSMKMVEVDWIAQVQEFSDRIAILLKTLLESDAHIENDFCTEGEYHDLELRIMGRLKPSHPVHRLLLLTEEILEKLDKWQDSHLHDWSREPISEKISLHHESFESLGMAYDLLAARDPVLKAADAISQKKGFCRMMEILHIEPIKSSLRPRVGLEGISHPSGRHWPGRRLLG
ncbi:hypothetical protein GGR57DRAFT_510388 [Xylariaceae sp. FL1272]|nr:hypothetical protein GGR57DRAFT_510388 [Xylariaceae sp. FL1272]